jgi:CheY-like chemotaxis protein
MSVSIMVVDDEPDVAELFRQRFRHEVRQGQYVMHFAASAEEALTKLDDGVQPELIVILSDINMPGMDGLGLLREVKRRRGSLTGAWGWYVDWRLFWRRMSWAIFVPDGPRRVPAWSVQHSEAKK